MLSFLIKAAIALAAAFVAIVGLLYVKQEAFIFPAPVMDGPVQRDDGFDLVSIDTPDGERLPALFHSATNGETTVLVFHGNGYAIDFLRPRGQALADAGFGVLLTEYRGYPGSTGTPSEQGLFIDGLAAYDFVSAGTDGPIAIYAHSLGTGVAAKVASERNVSAMVLESPFDSLMAVAQHHYFWAPVRWLLRHPFRSDERIGAIKAPVLIMHGERDRIIPIAHGHTLLKLAPEGTLFEEIKGAGHNDLAAFGTVERAIRFLKSAR